ncbi:MAG: hypothetical protein JJU24_07335 [Natronohydrobacter sp.]|nr:hypothetical protein [Natronohydrobacter sp.]
MGPELMFFLMLGGSALAGGLVGGLLISNGWRRAFGAIFAAHLFAMIGMAVAISQVDGTQGMSYAFALVMLVLPSMVGMAIGGGVMLWRRR